MTILEFRSKIKPESILIVDGIEIKVKEVVKFRFDDGSFYIKCFLSNDFVFADDLSSGTFLLVKTIRTPFKKPFLEKLEFESKIFSFLYSAHAVAEEIQGEEIFKKGNSESFWDYKAEDESYLSLGIIDNTKERMDFYGKIVSPNNVFLK